MTKNLHAQVSDARPIPEATRVASSAVVLRALFASVLPAVYGGQHRDHLKQVWVRVTSAGISAVATDGHWLAKADAPVGHKPGEVALAVEGPEVTVCLASEDVKRMLATFAPAKAKGDWGMMLVFSPEGLTVTGFGAAGSVVVPVHDPSGFPPWEQVLRSCGETQPASPALAVSAELLASACNAGRASYPRTSAMVASVHLEGTGEGTLEPIRLRNRDHALVRWLAVVMPVRV